VSSVARLGPDVHTTCPQLEDRDNEQEIQQHFHFTLSGQALSHDTLILPLFKEPGRCLMVTLSGHSPTGATPPSESCDGGSFIYHESQDQEQPCEHTPATNMLI